MQFSELKLNPSIMKAIHELGYKDPTEIQQKTMPLIMAGKDVIGRSETGSGKTAAFGLPMLSLLSHEQGLRALILTPTRELCMQVCQSLASFSKYLPYKIVPVFGGVGIGPQINALRKADIVVATPGRLLDIMSRGLCLNGVRYLVLDEADRMLDMGFIDDVEEIIRHTNRDRQTLLFSATISQDLQKLVHKYMKAPIQVHTKSQVDPALLTERAYHTNQDSKISLLVHLIKHETPGTALVFCATRHGCNKVAKKLQSQKIGATPIHGGLTQGRRTQAIEQLHRGGGVLVATDVASRGLHIKNITHVYNYDLPNTSEDYTHRIGRTARAGAKGDAITLVTSQEVRDFMRIIRDVKRDVRISEPPAFVKLVFPQGMGGRDNANHGDRGHGGRGHRPHKKKWFGRHRRR